LREALLDDLQDGGGVAHLGFADQEMEVLGHDHVSQDDEAILLASFFQDAQEEIATVGRAQPRPALVATTGDEVEVAGTVVSFEAAGHGLKIRC
jgi:hypothetical protein